MIINLTVLCSYQKSDSIHSKKKLETRYPSVNITMVQQLYGLHVTKDQQAIWELKNTMGVFYHLMRQSKEKGT